MTPAVVILALAAAAAPLSAVTTAERLPLPVGRDAVALHVHPFERIVVLDLPAQATAPVARRLRNASRLCPGVEAGPAGVTLRCTTARLRADLDLTTAEPTLDLRGMTVYPWRPEEEGPPLATFDPAGLGLGPCPGRVPEARGECLLAEGRMVEARAQFEQAVKATKAPLAYLRLGDLALAEDDVELALELWRHARVESPYGRLVGARLCEMQTGCLKGPERRAIFDVALVDAPVRADIVLRTARLKALEGDLMGTVRDLAAQMGPGGACETQLGWCRRLLLDVLSRPGPDGAESLALYLELPQRTEGPYAAELLRAAAAQAEGAGAPVFAANLLASATGTIPETALPAHLRRVAGLFLAGGDRARAEEIVLFARAHLDRATWQRDGWDGLQRRLHPTSAAAAAPTAPVEDEDLAAARRTAESARLLDLSHGARP